MAKRWPPPTYRVQAEFDAPLDFVFRWCTDYTPDDARYGGEHYRRLILDRSPRKVVYEDLEESKAGWFWSRHLVRLTPPDRWHSMSVGSHREISLDYRLSSLPGGRTRLVLTARRRPCGVGGRNPVRSQWERSVTEEWKRFGRVLERDFRKARSSRSG